MSFPLTYISDSLLALTVLRYARFNSVFRFQRHFKEGCWFQEQKILALYICTQRSKSLKTKRIKQSEMAAVYRDGE